MKFYILIFFSIVILLLSGCARNIPTKQQRTETLQNLILNLQYTTKIIKSSSYKFYTIQQQTQQCSNVHIYFEGDGLAWITRRLISDDPTPITPTTFKLVLQDEYPCKVYIARACQYTNDSQCTKKDWTSHRFSKQIISATNEVINKIKKEFKNRNFIFIGYSGGAAIASLVANDRDDVTNFISVAGNLDTQLWTRMKHLKPLIGSLNPADYTSSLQTLKQYHLHGINDSIIPFEVTQSYMKQFQNKQNIKYKKVDATHNCCYEKAFKEIIQRK